MGLSKKVSYSVLMLLLSYSYAIANDTNREKVDDDSGVFIGVDMGALMQKAKTTTNIIYNTGKYKAGFSDSDLVGDFGLKIGYYLNSSHRLYASYHYNTYSNTSGTTMLPYGSVGNTILNDINASYNAHKFTIGYDYLPYITDNGKAILGAYAGYGISNAKYNVVGSLISKKNFTITNVKLNPNNYDNNAGIWIAGINIGYLYETGFGDLEFGVKVEYTQSQETSQNVISQIHGGKPEQPTKRNSSVLVISVFLC